MARRRFADWEKLAQSFRGRPGHVKLTWFGLLATVDLFGLAHWSPLQVGSVFLEADIDAGKVSVKQVAATMESFCEGDDPELVSWEQQGQRYLAMPKQQDYQGFGLLADALCPFPPEQTFWRLSAATRGLLCAGLAMGRFTSVAEREFTDLLLLYGKQGPLPPSKQGDTTKPLQKHYVILTPTGVESLRKSARAVAVAVAVTVADTEAVAVAEVGGGPSGGAREGGSTAGNPSTPLRVNGPSHKCSGEGGTARLRRPWEAGDGSGPHPPSPSPPVERGSR